MNRVTKIDAISVVIFSMTVLIGAEASGQVVFEPTAHAETFLQKVIEGDIDDAYEFLFGEFLTANPDRAEAIKQKTISQLTLHGELLGFEKVSEETFGTSVVRLVYILKHERHPVLWQFHYYRPHTSWGLINVRFSDRYDWLGLK